MSESNSTNKELFPFKPLHVRIREYNQARDRIFNDCGKKRKSALRMKTFWGRVKIFNRKLVSSILNRPSDVRPYAEVTLFGKRMLGLLDTGASITCIGSDAARNFLESGAPFKKLKSTVQTADGKGQNVVGYTKAFVTFRDSEMPITVFIVPGLDKDLFLGIDFWEMFNLLPAEFRNDRISSSSSLGEISTQIPLTNSQKHRLDRLVSLFPSYSKEGLGRTDVLCHSIDTGDAKPIKQRHFPVSPAIEKLIYEEIDRMIALDVIEESNSPWSSPVVLHRKPGKNRLCLDSRKLNSVTIGDAYPLPQIDGILSRLPKAQFITSLDLKDAFWQIPLDQKSREKTAFTVPGRPLYHFKVMPFGLCNAPPNNVPVNGQSNTSRIKGRGICLSRRSSRHI